VLSDQSEDLDQDILVSCPYEGIYDGKCKARLDAFYHFCRFKKATELRNKYETLKKTPFSSFILITGPAGVGKTSLATTLKLPVEKDGGYFLRGNFDFLQRPEPYTAFVAAFTEFTNLVIARGKEAIKKTKLAIQSALREEMDVLVGMIPSLERIMERKHVEECKRSAAEAFKRLIFVSDCLYDHFACLINRFCCCWMICTMPILAHLIFLRV